MQNIVQYKNVYKSFGDTRALSDISFNIHKNEIFGLIGPDGAGKSTLMRILATLYIPDRGEVFLKNLNVEEKYQKVRELIGYMPGEFSLYPDLTVEENLNFFASIFDTTIEENYELIRDLYSHIEKFRNRKAGQLSGGMQQKLALSCALVHRPQLLILDEPNTGVDAVSRDELWKMLYKLKDQGFTVLISTPYMDEAEKCDRIALMQNGQHMAVDTPEQIVNQFGENLNQIDSSNLYRTLNELRNHNMVKRAYLFGQNIHMIPKQGEFEWQEVKKSLENKGLFSIKCKKIQPDIEDCFIKLMEA